MEKINKWKKYSIISTIFSFIFIIITTTSSGAIWELARILLLISGISLCITASGYIYVFKKEKGKLPLITTVMIAIIITGVIIFIGSKINDYQLRKEFNEQYQENLEKSKNMDKSKNTNKTNRIIPPDIAPDIVN